MVQSYGLRQISRYFLGNDRNKAELINFWTRCETGILDDCQWLLLEHCNIPRIGDSGYQECARSAWNWLQSPIHCNMTFQILVISRSRWRRTDTRTHAHACTCTYTDTIVTRNKQTPSLQALNLQIRKR
ncbi:hypothetical protein J6590_095462 [Homalodisca vitripennis]|nr:hypothetical protein J6590_095462 [Homalodisca vitripennis]